jgi:hypothetical protein
MLDGQKALRIGISNVTAQKSAVSELVLQQLESYGAIGETGAGELQNVDLLVTTGAEFSAKMLGQAELLILDATEANKKSLLSEIGFHTSGDAWAYFIGKAGPRRFRVIELAKDDTVGVHKARITPVDKTQPLGAELVRSASKTAVSYHRPDLAVADLVSAILDHRTERSSAVAAADDPVPPDVKKWTISYTLVAKRTISNFGKTQEPSMSITYDIVAFLNNPPSGSHYQYVYIRQKGVVNPGVLMDYSTYYKGYGQFQVETSIVPTTHLEELVYDASSPPNVNDKHTIQSKIGFGIDYTKSGGGSAKFNYEQTITQDVFDWQIIERTTTSHMKWVFAQRYPFNWLARTCGADSGDHAPFDFWDRVKAFPNLTQHTLQPQTQSVWRTTKVLNEPVTFFGTVRQELGYFWYRFLWFECPEALLIGFQSMTVDLSKVSD